MIQNKLTFLCNRNKISEEISIIKKQKYLSKKQANKDPEPAIFEKEYMQS